MEETFSTDQNIEIFKSLEFTYEQLILAKNKSYHWKWAIIGIHGGLQICMATALRDSSGTNILKENIRDKYYKSLREGKFGTVEEKLNYFLELYKDIKSKEIYKYGIECKFIPEENDDENILRLNEIRNVFIHFIPMGFCYYVVEFLDLFYTSLRIMNILVRDIINIVWVEENEETNTIELLDKLKTLLDEYSKELKAV